MDMADPKRSVHGRAWRSKKAARGKRTAISRAGKNLKSASSQSETAARSAAAAAVKKNEVSVRGARIVNADVRKSKRPLTTVGAGALSRGFVDDELRRAENLRIPVRADLVAKALGSRAELAKVLRVSPSQPTRWIKGQETPNSENTRAIVDLEHVVARARLLWADDDVVNSWLTSNNGFLDGARPVDVIATQGSGPVIDALDQALAGAFA